MQQQALSFAVSPRLLRRALMVSAFVFLWLLVSAGSASADPGKDSGRSHEAPGRDALAAVREHVDKAARHVPDDRPVEQVGRVAADTAEQARTAVEVATEKARDKVSAATEGVTRQVEQVTGQVERTVQDVVSQTPVPEATEDAPGAHAEMSPTSQGDTRETPVEQGETRTTVVVVDLLLPVGDAAPSAVAVATPSSSDQPTNTPSLPLAQGLLSAGGTSAPDRLSQVGDAGCALTVRTFDGAQHLLPHAFVRPVERACSPGSTPD